MRRLCLSVAVLLTAAGAAADPAVPPAPPLATVNPVAAAPARIRGMVGAFDGATVTVTLEGHKTVLIGLTPDTRMIHNRSLRLADLPTGGWVGVAALKGADGKLRAMGVRLYPQSMQGQGEGEYPLDPNNPARLLINGTVAGTAPDAAGGTLTVAFHGAAASQGECTGHADAGGAGCSGGAEVQIARGVPILSIEPGDPSLLLPGAVLTVSAAPDAAGQLVATSITIERDAPAPKP